jgi:hypothetical protein
MAQSVFFATFMGCIVTEAFFAAQKGSVLGLSSKGIFLQVGTYVLFITNAPYKSPFNIYVLGFNRLLETLKQGEHFEVKFDSMHFEESGTRILIENVEKWTPGPPLAIDTRQATRKKRVKLLIDDIVEIDPNKGWLFLYTESDRAEASRDFLKERIWEGTQKFTEGYRVGELSQCLVAAESLIGLGGGLTPSGDDWLAGFVLYLERFSYAGNVRSGFLQIIGNALQDLAFQKTTTISANRIMAARRGWAEEPFLNVIDTLFSTQSQFDPELAGVLVRFGHSSGVDTLLGISAAIDCE